ncbi:IS3 family transposase [Mesorhizobium xinjiangense]|uniref:IS3 family transposase n=1 Tax=Mesorhizobium xinjiangense TaxID=2678685 RepID=UPI0038B2EA74
MKTRRRFTAEFKAKVALEAIRGERTISELATKHQLHPNQITQWKRQAIENLAKAFDDKASDAQAGREAEVTKLHAKIGQLVVERDFLAKAFRSLSLDRRRMMIDPDHNRLSIRRQCELVSISRASFYRQPAGETPENLELMRIIDEAFMEMPWYGSRQMARHLRRQGWCVGRKRVRRLMRKIGLSPIYQAPKTSEPHPQHRIYPYLLRHLAIERPDQVWCADVTYIPMRRGFLYLVAIMDWFSRKVLAWRLSNTMEADFCVAALEEAIARHGKPDIFNTDQGSQFTSFAFTATLKDAGIRISMDGRGRWMDNVFIERLWRSLKYECVFLSAFETGSEARNGIGSWMDYYNRRRPHSTFAGRTPDEVYATAETTERLAA